MSVVSKPAPARSRKRLASALIAAALCTLLGACGNDDSASQAKLSSTDSLNGNSNRNPSMSNVLPADPSLGSAGPTSHTIQTPPLSASGTDATQSAVAAAPLVTPVIHTVD
jgi:hypothetical protein